MGFEFGVLASVAVILAFVATILAFIFIVPEKRRERMNAFGRFLHDTVNFKYLIIEKILQAVYIFFTAYVILLGFFMLFQTMPSYYGYGGTWMGGYGILVMIAGPIAIRLVYELLMMTIILVKNVISINSKLKGDGSKGKDYFAAPDLGDVKEDIRRKMNAMREAAAQPAPAQHANFCQNCGSRLGEDGSCPVCSKTDA